MDPYSGPLQSAKKFIFSACTFGKLEPMYPSQKAFLSGLNYHSANSK